MTLEMNNLKHGSVELLRVPGRNVSLWENDAKSKEQWMSWTVMLSKYMECMDELGVDCIDECVLHKKWLSSQVS